MYQRPRFILKAVQPLVLSLLLASILVLFLPAVQDSLRHALKNQPRTVWAIPVILTAIFSGASVLVGTFSLPLTAAVLVYLLLPTAATTRQLDFLAVLLLWLPIELNLAKDLVPRHAQGFLHSVAYGVAILLALILFLCYRNLPGLKYQLSRNRRDFWIAFAAFAITAPVLIVLGIAIGFIPWPHLPNASGGKMAGAAGIIFAGTALPEEILFRSLIQNLIGRRFGRGWRTLLLASFIFGCAHLNNGPQPAPNWRYMILATVAGIAYGKVFEMASSVVSSALLHTMVDWTKHFFF